MLLAIQIIQKTGTVNIEGGRGRWERFKFSIRQVLKAREGVHIGSVSPRLHPVVSFSWWSIQRGALWDLFYFSSFFFCIGNNGHVAVLRLSIGCLEQEWNVPFSWVYDPFTFSYEDGLLSLSWADGPLFVLTELILPEWNLFWSLLKICAKKVR